MSIYDQIMASIDPGLIKSSIQRTLAENAPGLGERCAKAFAEYDRRYAAWRKGRIHGVRKYRGQLFTEAEADMRTIETQRMLKIESQFS